MVNNNNNINNNKANVSLDLYSVANALAHIMVIVGIASRTPSSSAINVLFIPSAAAATHICNHIDIQL